MASSGTETVAKTLMGATGQAFKITGFALSSVSTLYFAHALTGTGKSIIEYLPQLVNATTTKTFMNHMAENSTLGMNATFLLGASLLAGVILRKLGTVVSDENNIKKTENFLYGTSVKNE